MQSLITNLGSKGVWNDTTQYYKNNLAVFNGSTFIASQDNLGKTPPTLPTQSNAYWSLFAEKGATGNTGLQGPPGKDGTGVTIIGSLPSEQDLPPVGAPGDAYMIEGNLYVWQDNTNTWKNVGPIQGPQGKSAYDLAVENGFIGTMEEWIESLKGMQGPQGPEGPPGPPADLTEINQQVSTLQIEVNEHVTGIATTEKLGHIRSDGKTFNIDPVTGVASVVSSGGLAAKYTGDLNDLIEPGIYSVPENTPNAPNSYPLLVEVLTSSDGKLVVQRVTYSHLGNATIPAFTRRALKDATGSLVWSTQSVGAAGYLGNWRIVDAVLNDSIDSASINSVATSNAVKKVNDKLRANWIATSTTSLPFKEDYTGAVRFRKVLTTVEVLLDLSIVGTTLTANVEYTMFTLPVGYRPYENAVGHVRLIANITNTYVPVQIASTGQVIFRHTTTVAVDSLVKGQLTFATGESLN